MSSPSALVSRVWGWFAVPPVTGDESRDRRAHVQLRLLGFLLLSIPVIVAAALLGEGNTTESVASMWVPMTLVVLGLVGIVRSGWLAVSGWIITAALFVLVSASIVLYGGMAANNAVAYIVVVMVAGAALGRREAIGLAVVAAVAAGIAAWVESRGWMPAPIVPASLLNSWIALTSTLVMCALLHDLAIRTLDVAFDRVSRALAELREARAENELRALHGSALAQLAARSLEVRDCAGWCREAAGLLVTLLGADQVLLIEADEQRRASATVLAGPPRADGAEDEVDLSTTALGPNTPGVIGLSDPALRGPLLALGALPDAAGGLLAPIPGSPSPHGFLVVLTREERRHRRSDEQLLDTLASLVGTLMEREIADERARQAQRLELLGRVTGSVSHDFNNLLQAILSSTRAMRRAGDPAALAVLLDEVDDAARRARGLTGQVVAFSQPNGPKLARLDLAAEVRGSLPLLRRLVGPQVRVDAVLPAEPAWVDADRPGLDQVLLNLLVNARDAMPAGGAVEVRVEAGPSGIRLSVRDQGMGIDAMTRRRIFQPFFSTKEGGTGLGLPTVADVAHRHGAELDVVSAPGEGTTFALTYPHSVAPPDPVVPPAPVGAGRVLVAEDHPLVRATTERTLRAAGYTVVAVGSGAEARASVEAGPAFDLLVTDVAMPDIDGPRLVAELEEAGRGLPVLYISGYVDAVPDEPDRPTWFLAKPFTHDELLTAAAACIVSAGPRPPASSTAR